MSEEDRDYKLGLRAVVLEEFVMSFLNLPHLIALPAKCISFLLYYLPYPSYLNKPNLFFRKGFIPVIYFFNGQNMQLQQIAQSCYSTYRPDYQFSFFHVQINLAHQLGIISLGLLEMLTWLTVHLDLLMIRVLSGGVYYPLSAIATGAPLPPPRGLRILQVLQVLWMLIHIVLRTVLAAGPFVLCLIYSEYSIVGCVVGPFFLFVPWYILIYANVSTLFLVLHHFPYYAPLTNFRNATVSLAHSAYSVSSGFLSMLNAKLQSVYSLVVRGLTHILSLILQVYLIQKLRLSSGNLLRKYASILFKAGKILRPYGLLGDLIFTPLTVLWMFWPLIIPYYLEEPYYYLPTGLLCCILTIKG